MSHPSCRTVLTHNQVWNHRPLLEICSVAPPPDCTSTIWEPAGSFTAVFGMSHSLIHAWPALALISHSYTSSVTNSQKPRDQIPGHYSRKGTPLWSTAAVSNQLKSAPRSCRPPLCRHPGGLPGPMLAMSKTQEMLMETLKWLAEGILVNKATLRGWGRRLSSLPWRELQ